MRFENITVGETIALGSRSITPLPANHTVPAVGYQMDSGEGSLVFTGDTGGQCPEFWAAVNKMDNLKHLIIETAFSNSERRLAQISKHLCPSLLVEELAQLQRDAEIYITHLKPGQIELTMQEIEDGVGELRPRMLQNNQVFEL
jgi:ribonuclease BN (tRNA processing enzyme)